jgi:peroxiredoxin
MPLKFQSKFFLFFAILLLFSVCGKTTAAPTAPGFEVQDLDGHKISLAQQQGKIVILEFWSVSCRACQMSIPELNELQKEYQDKGLTVIGITIDQPNYVSDDLLMKFMDYFKINFKIGRANQQVLQDYFAGQFRISLPTIFIIDRRGKIVKRFEGYAEGEMRKALKEYF